VFLFLFGIESSVMGVRLHGIRAQAKELNGWVEGDRPPEDFLAKECSPHRTVLHLALCDSSKNTVWGRGVEREALLSFCV
jgi:hypothetical protein